LLIFIKFMYATGMNIKSIYYFCTILKSYFKFVHICGLKDKFTPKSIQIEKNT